MKPIFFTKHALDSMRKRGVFKNEVEDTIRKTAWQPAKLGRWECAMDFAYNKEWNKKFYRTKQVVPVFVEERDRIVVITVYAFYF